MSTEDLKGRWVTANRDNTPVLEYDPRYGVPVWKGGAGGKVAVVDARQDADQDIRNAAMEAAAIQNVMQRVGDCTGYAIQQAFGVARSVAKPDSDEGGQGAQIVALQNAAYQRAYQVVFDRQAAAKAYEKAYDDAAAACDEADGFTAAVETAPALDLGMKAFEPDHTRLLPTEHRELHSRT